MPKLKGSVTSDAYADPRDALSDVMGEWEKSAGLSKMTPSQMYLVIPGVGSVSFRNYSEKGFEREIGGKLDNLRYGYYADKVRVEIEKALGREATSEEIQDAIEMREDEFNRDWDEMDYIVEIRGHSGRYKQTEA